MLETQSPALGLGHLDNRPDPQTSKTIHPYKVVRLQRSLRRLIFPTLHPDEIEALARTFGLSFAQKVRLHAAYWRLASSPCLPGA